MSKVAAALQFIPFHDQIMNLYEKRGLARVLIMYIDYYLININGSEA